MVKTLSFRNRFERVKDFVSSIDSSFLRFLIVGGVNTLFGYSIYGLLLLFGLHYTLAVLISTILGVFFNFKTIGTYVFKNGKWRLIMRFGVVYGVIYIINTGILTLFNDIKFNLYLAQAVAVLPMAILSFVLNKMFVFRERAR